MFLWNSIEFGIGKGKEIWKRGKYSLKDGNYIDIIYCVWRKFQILVVSKTEITFKFSIMVGEKFQISFSMNWLFVVFCFFGSPTLSKGSYTIASVILLRVKDLSNPSNNFSETLGKETILRIVTEPFFRKKNFPWAPGVKTGDFLGQIVDKPI